MGHLAVAYISSVEPYIEAGINAFKVQICSGSFRILLIIKILNVSSAGIIDGNIGRVQGKWVPHIGVLVAVITKILPDPRHRNPVVILQKRIAGYLIKLLFQIIDTVIIFEVPQAVQHLDTV